VEIGIGYELGMAMATGDNDDDILLLKSCVGNRALGWDLLPPGSPGFEVREDDYHESRNKSNSTTIWHYAGYHQYPERWQTGTKNGDIDDINNTNFNGTNISWYGGHQYDGDVFRAKSVLQNLRYYMGYNDSVDDSNNNEQEEFKKGEIEYEVTGIFFWQGDRDAYNNDPMYAKRYCINLERFVTALRLDFKAPEAKFVLATLGQTQAIDGKDNNKTIQTVNDNNRKAEKALRFEMQERLVFNTQMELPKHHRFFGNTATVYTYPLVRGRPNTGKINKNDDNHILPSSTNHYKKSLDIYMNVGFAMGQAMVDLLAHSENDNNSNNTG